MQIHWTMHAKDKMRYYKLSESRIKRILNYPKRIEEGIAKNTVAMTYLPDAHAHGAGATRVVHPATDLPERKERPREEPP